MWKGVSGLKKKCVQAVSLDTYMNVCTQLHSCVPIWGTAWQCAIGVFYLIWCLLVPKKTHDKRPKLIGWSKCVSVVCSDSSFCSAFMTPCLVLICLDGTFLITANCAWLEVWWNLSIKTREWFYFFLCVWMFLVACSGCEPGFCSRVETSLVVYFSRSPLCILESANRPHWCCRCVSELPLRRTLSSSSDI